MHLIVGLGNPGRRYEKNRHNVGFMAIDRIAWSYRLPAFQSKFQGQFCQSSLGGNKFILLKPQTFMNLSGFSVSETARFFKISPQDIVVLHDELDLAPGKIRYKTGGGTAGHNGLKSIEQQLSTKNFNRLRIGIGHPGQKELVSGYVLSDFSKADEEWLDNFLSKQSEALEKLLTGDVAGYLNMLATK